ncbi:hypothetical protein CK203_039834 [Vitis vinifera]|uniref:DUF4283 domain-containing protein n=1 Tax=Vitis vinifera TaxID=29760 RepID=A0A438HQF0_VITVI|nr:hypothetical protein CK203_039834 [Vitis vinifera]
MDGRGFRPRIRPFTSSKLRLTPAKTYRLGHFLLSSYVEHNHCKSSKMIRNQSVVVERKISRFWRGGDGLASGAVRESCGVGGFEGYIRKMRGKTRTHMMEICFNSRGCYMKITEYSAKRKPLVLVVPRGVNGCGWENLREGDCFSPRDLCSSWERIAGDAKPSFKRAKECTEVRGPTLRWLQRKEQRMVQGCQLENGQERWFVKAKEKYVTGVRKAQWFQERGSLTVRGEVFALRRWSPEENSVQWGRVTKVARNSLKFVDLSKVTLRVEMLPKVVLPALLEVEDGDRTYTVAVTVTGEDDGEDDEGDSIKPESSRSKDELRSAGVASCRSHRWLRGYELLIGPVTAKDGCPVIVSILALQIQNRLRGRKEREDGCWGQWREAILGQHQTSLKPVLFGPKLGRRILGQ